jgi:hypothetical protein
MQQQQQQQQKRNVLFYSKSNKLCNELISKIQATPHLTGLIILFCIDGLPKEKIPSFVNTLPTLYIGINRVPLAGNQVVHWIELQEQQQQQQQQQLSSSPQQNQPPPAPATPLPPPNSSDTYEAQGGPGAYSSEIGGMYSDGYSFLDDSAKPLQHSFSFLGGAGGGGGGGGGGGHKFHPSVVASSNERIKSTSHGTDLTSRLELFKNQRDNDFQRR